MVDLFLAGMETTTTSLMIITLHLLHHPEVQKKVHEEIDEVKTRENP
jgi:cytochrome P450